MRRVVGGANGWNKIRKSGGNALRNDRCYPRNRIGKKKLLGDCYSGLVPAQQSFHSDIIIFFFVSFSSDLHIQQFFPYPGCFSFYVPLGRPLNTPLRCSRKLNSDMCLCVLFVCVSIPTNRLKWTCFILKIVNCYDVKMLLIVKCIIQ
jgi:hypothetical protein